MRMFRFLEPAALFFELPLRGAKAFDLRLERTALDDHAIALRAPFLEEGGDCREPPARLALPLAKPRQARFLFLAGLAQSRELCLGGGEDFPGAQRLRGELLDLAGEREWPGGFGRGMRCAHERSPDKLASARDEGRRREPLGKLKGLREGFDERGRGKGAALGRGEPGVVFEHHLPAAERPFRRPLACGSAPIRADQAEGGQLARRLDRARRIAPSEQGV